MSTKKKGLLTPEEKQLRKVRARRQFKALIRRVIDNLYWLEDADDGFGDNVLLNVQMLTKKKKKPQSILTINEKSILNKNKSERSEEEKNILHKKIGGLKCFRRYPSFVKNQLAAVTYYRYFAPGRVIVRQNDEGYAMYFILEGEVLVTQSYYDKHLKEVVTVELGTMLPGSGFGEVSLLHGIKRTATITTLTDCEFLEVKKEDFETVLKATVMAEWDEIKRCMSFFDYFKEWNEVAMRECCILGKKEVFKPEETIVGDGEGKTDFVHLIVRGSADVIENIPMKCFVVAGKKCYKLLNDEEEALYSDIQRYRQSVISSSSKTKFNSPENDMTLREKEEKIMKIGKIDSRFFRVCVLNKLACFNLGENLNNRRIVAREETECLLVPQYWLFQPQQNKANIWDRVKQYMNQRIPSTKQIYHNFMQERKWAAYKRELFDTIYNDVRRGSDNSIENVPFSIRIKDNIDYY